VVCHAIVFFFFLILHIIQLTPQQDFFELLTSHTHSTQGAQSKEFGATIAAWPQVSLYKILFQSKVLLSESLHLFIPPPYLQRLPFCNTIARLLRNIRPPTAPPSVCHTPYTIGDGNIVQRPSHTTRGDIHVLSAPWLRGSVDRRVRSVTRLRLEWYGGVFFLLQQRSKHPREMVITPKASTSSFVRTPGFRPFHISRPDPRFPPFSRRSRSCAARPSPPVQTSTRR